MAEAGDAWQPDDAPATVPRPTRPYTWAEILEHTGPGGDVAKLGRSRPVLLSYGQFKSQVLQEFNDMQDYVLQKVFGYPAEQDPTTGRLRVGVPPDRGSRALLLPNDFPYYLEPEMGHHVIWFEDGVVSEAAVHALAAAHLGGREWVWFENPVAARSIPGIAHIHILSRPAQPG